MERKLAVVRPINKGTNYDVSGHLRKLARDLDSGKYGRSVHMVCAVLVSDTDGPAVVTNVYGTGTIQDACYLIEKLRKRVIR